jgi:hypothetical protein
LESWTEKQTFERLTKHDECVIRLVTRKIASDRVELSFLTEDDRTPVVTEGQSVLVDPAI